MRRPTTEQLDNLVGIQEIADLLGAKATTVNSWIARGQLPAPLIRRSGKPLYWWPTIEVWDQDRRAHAHP